MEPRRSEATLSRRTLLRAAVGGAALAAGLIRTAAPARGQAPSPPMVGLVTPRATGDLGVVDDLVAGLERVAAELGAATELAIAPDAPAQREAIRRLAGNGASVIVVAFPEAAATLHALAPTLPGVRFVHLGADPGAPDLPNLRSVTYDTWPAAWLAGVLGATVSMTRQLGFVGADDAAATNADLRGLIGGAQSVDRLVAVEGVVVGDPVDIERSRQLTEGLIAAGSDVVLADAGAADQGVVAAAGSTGTFAIVGSEALAEAAPASVLAVLGVLVGQSLFEQTRAALEPDWTGGELHSGLADGLVDLSINEAFLAQGPAEMAGRVRDARPLVDNLREQLIAGSIVPRYDPRPVAG